MKEKLAKVIKAHKKAVTDSDVLYGQLTKASNKGGDTPSIAGAKKHSYCSEKFEGMGASLRDVQPVRDRRIIEPTIRGQNHWRYERIWTGSGSFVRGMRECEDLD